ncbi:hypothetical protein [Halococcoides cellulosivorans]|uniref:Uncharacterized protein n=1 Tax=Halococcoides cellulosivorans TaxID=1679096 RepID=A0A2R4WYX0_9EURY|nr:hypothetical protein [Halococcoides cellulosivorans]AWB26715.1 hypothetical protein HARCEL1_02790 [Halococcoides cellulosivorans]
MADSGSIVALRRTPFVIGTVVIGLAIGLVFVPFATALIDSPGNSLPLAQLLAFPIAVAGTYIGKRLISRSLSWPDPEVGALVATLLSGWVVVWVAVSIPVRGFDSLTVVFLSLGLGVLAILGATLVAMRRDPLAA